MGSMAFADAQQKNKKETIKITTDAELGLLHDSDEVWFNYQKFNNREIAMLVRRRKKKANHITAVKMQELQ